MADEAVKVLHHPYSQPCRAVLLLMHANKIPYEPVETDISKGEEIIITMMTAVAIKIKFAEESKEALKQVNPILQIPAINDNGFCLAER